MLTALRGVPDRPLSEKDMAAFLRASLEEIASLRPWKDRLIWRDPSSFWSGGRFRSGETAFYAGNMGLVLPRMSGVSFRWNGVFAAAEPGMHQEPGLTLIGMAADAPQPGPSEEMLRFLASPAAQEEITRAGMSGAYLTAANRGLLAHLRAADPASLDAALRAQAIRGPETNALGNVLDYDLRDLYQDTLMGRRTAAEALPLALDTVRSRMGQQPPPPQK